METEDHDFLSLRQLIQTKADRLGIAEQIANLSDTASIRRIQAHEGYTPCFGRVMSLVLHPDANISDEEYLERYSPFARRMSYHPRDQCGEFNCLWKPFCDSSRQKEFLGLDVMLAEEPQVQIEMIRAILLSQVNSRDSLLGKDAVGVKVGSFKNIFSLTRKLLITAPRTVFAENLDQLESFRRVIVRREIKTAYDPRHPAFSCAWDVILSADVSALASWIQSAQAFVKNGNLAYMPLYESYQRNVTLGREYIGLMGDQPDKIFGEIPFVPESAHLQTFDAPHLGREDGEIMLTKAEYAPVLNLDLPVIENVDFATLYTLMKDYPEELAAFRDFLFTKVEELRSAAVGSEEFYATLGKVEREIRDHLRKLRSDYKKKKLQTAFGLTNCFIASWSLALYCILNGSDNILTILGPGGIAYKLAETYSAYLTSQLELKDNPVYFLWLIGRKGGKF